MEEAEGDWNLPGSAVGSDLEITSVERAVGLNTRGEARRSIDSEAGLFIGQVVLTAGSLNKICDLTSWYHARRHLSRSGLIFSSHANFCSSN